MVIWQVIVLGVVQGITEFFPVSSSGHLNIARVLMDLDNTDFSYIVEFINLGTLLALVLYFSNYIVKILRDIFIKHDFKLAFNVILTCIPAGLAGLFLDDFIESTDFFGDITSLAIAMGVVGVIMILIDKLPHAKPLKDETALTKPRAFMIGLAQAIALIPGVSRSGSTILAGRFAGFNNKSAATYSFLVSIPIMCGVCLKTLLSSDNRLYLASHLDIFLISNSIAFIVGILAVSFAMWLLAKPKSLEGFGFYRVILSLLIIIITLII